MKDWIWVHVAEQKTKKKEKKKTMAGGSGEKYEGRKMVLWI